jgi:hypothetical protein
LDLDLMPRGTKPTPETLAKMAEGRRKALERKRLAVLNATDDEGSELAEPVVLKSVADDLWDGVLTDKEKADLDAAADQKARSDHRKAVRAAYAKDAVARAKAAIGAVPVDEVYQKLMEEEVRLYVDMPRLRKPNGGEHAPEPIIIDQVAYVAGHYYSMPRGRAIYVQWLMDQARRHVNAVDGRSRSYYNPEIHQVVHQGGVAAGGASLGPGFDVIHKRAK